MDVESFVIVANSMKPYIFEATKILGLPRGAQFQARFERRWVQNKVIDNPENCIGRTGYIVQRDYERDILYPLCKLQVLSIQVFGSFALIVYVLKDYFNYSSDEKTRERQIKSINKNFFSSAKRLGIVHAPGEDMLPLVFHLNYEPRLTNNEMLATDSESQEIEKWLNTVSLFSGMKLLHGVPFLKVQISETKKNRLIKPKGHAYTLKPNARYSLQLIHRISEGRTKSKSGRKPKAKYMKTGPYHVNTSSLLDRIAVSPGSLIATGRYDVMRIWLTPEVNANYEERIVIAPTVSKEVSESYDPRIYLDIRVRRDFWSIALKGVGLTAFLLIYAIFSFADGLSEVIGKKLIDFIVVASVSASVFSFIELIADLWRILKGRGSE